MKMFGNDKIHSTGVFPPEAVDAETRAYCMREAEKLDITFEEFIVKHSS